MSNKQALRDFQAHLARRLHSAQTQGVTAAFLGILAGERKLLLALAHSGEIFGLPALTRVPHTRAWFCGVANLRGGLYGVVDLRAFLSAQPLPARTDEAWSQVRLVTLNASLGVNVALVADGLLGLRRPDMFASVQPAQPVQQPSGDFMGRCFVDSAGEAWWELDARALAAHPDFLRIGE